MNRPDPDLERRLRQHVEALAVTPRPPGSRAHDNARIYIRNHLQVAGFTVTEDVRRALDGECINLLTNPVPDLPSLPLVIVGAHYDSTPDTPGADDNASAVAALLELAVELYPQLRTGGHWTARLQLVAYDMEEYGMVGSHFHTQSLSDPVRCMISLEMLGYTDKRRGGQKLPPQLAGLYPDVGDFIGVVGNETSRHWMETVTAASKEIEGLPVE